MSVLNMQLEENDLNFLDLILNVDDEPLRNPLDTQIDDANTREIFTAVVNGDFETFQRALRGNPNLKHPSGFSLLHFAIFHKRRNIFLYLLDLGANFEEKIPTHNDTCLGWMLSQSNVADEDFICELIKRGADVNCKFFSYTSSSGVNALLLALDRKYVEPAKLLISHGFDLSSAPIGYSYIKALLLCGISSAEKYDIVSMMIYYGLLVSPKDFYMSVERKEDEIQQLLFDCAFDDLGDHCKVPLYILVTLMERSPTIFERLKTKVTRIKLDLPFDTPIFNIPPSGLLWLLENFPDEAKFWLNKLEHFAWKNDIELYFKTFKILLESELKFDFLTFLDTNNFRYFFRNLVRKSEGTIPDDILQDFILFLVSYGIDIYTADIEELFERFEF